jgi:hypothetical protein
MDTENLHYEELVNKVVKDFHCCVRPKCVLLGFLLLRNHANSQKFSGVFALSKEFLKITNVHDVIDGY